MQIICDSTESTFNLLGKNLLWTDCARNLQSSAVQQLFPDSAILYKSEISFLDWNVMCITRHTRESQFSILSGRFRHKHNLSDRFICAAESGDNFKGYRGRSWVSENGNIHLSVVLQPGTVIEHFEVGFTVLAVVSVIQAIDEIPELNSRCRIRWVNDLVIDSKKIGGVIAYTQGTGNRISGVVIGIGLNVETTPQVETDIFVPQVASLSDYTSCTRNAVFLPLLSKLQENYNLLLKGGYQKLLDFYRSRSTVLNREVTVYSDPRSGKAEKIVRGKVTHIGKNLELNLSGTKNSIFTGRLVIEP